MKTLRWKLRYARRLRALLHLSWWQCWEHAGGALESYADLTESPEESAEYEYDVWCQDADPSLLDSENS